MMVVTVEVEKTGKIQHPAADLGGLGQDWRREKFVSPLFRGSMPIEEKDIHDLIAALEEGPERRSQAQLRLAALGERVVEPLMEVVSAEKGQKAWAAAEVLGELADPRAFQVLVAALYARNPMLGGVALKGLLKYAGRDILPYLVLAFPQAHIMTQQNMILVLQRLGDRRAVMVLIEQLSSSTSSSIRMCIIQTLGKLGDPAAIPAVRARLNDSNQHVREWAAFTLKQLEMSAV
jgi:HEAT repeat protein